MYRLREMSDDEMSTNARRLSKLRTDATPVRQREGGASQRGDSARLCPCRLSVTAAVAHDPTALRREQILRKCLDNAGAVLG